MMLKKAVYFFCIDQTKDPVASNVFNLIKTKFSLQNKNITVDGNAVYDYVDQNGYYFSLVQTNNVISHDYAHYIPILKDYFSDYNFAGLINWHEGTNAPDKIFSLHTTGDVPTGNYAPADAVIMKNLIVSLEKNRKLSSLDDFSVLTEGTHWSGIPYGGDPKLIPEFLVPLFDIEIGSTKESWSNKAAAEVIADSIFTVFDNLDQSVISLLCVGGVHFERSYIEAVLLENSKYNIAISHILPNQWIVSGRYDNEEGLEKIKNCINSIKNSIKGIVFHDNLKGVYKEQLRIIAKELNIPVFKHNLLKKIETVGF
jgi:D-tyrosyl-tRNA(Tyr) deacylase